MSGLDAHPLTQEAFAPFGDVIELGGDYKTINQGNCRRYTDLASLDLVEGRAGVSLFKAKLSPNPYPLMLVERHPLGSQCFLPMEGSTYLVIVAPDENGTPGKPVAFHARADQGVNFHRNIWHGVLAPTGGSGLFAVVDRIGEGDNLQEHWFDEALNVRFDDLS